MADHKKNPDNPTLVSRRPTLLRALFTVGLLCRHFDFDSKDMGETKVSELGYAWNIEKGLIYNNLKLLMMAGE